MRIASYNILHGGEGRADPIAEILQAQRADVICLVEADLLEVVERIARRLGTDFVHAPGVRHASAILSRWPIIDSINHGRLRGTPRGSLLEATVRDPSGTDWPIFAVHLHPNATEADEDARLREIQTLLELTADHRQANRPHVVAGDFNATSPIQQIDPALCLPKTRDQWQANGLSLPRRAIGALLAAGYVDTLHASIGEAAATAGTFSTQFPGQRVDYIMTWGVPRARIRRAWIEQDRLARFASDHYPVGAEVE